MAKASTVVFLFCFHLNCLSQGGYEYIQPKTLDDGWSTSSLAESTYDLTRIKHFFQELNSGPHEIHSVLVIQNDKLVLEEYFNGYAVDQIHDLRSVSKSIRSLLMGIAIDKGFVTSVNEPISTYLKSHEPLKNLDDSKDRITIRHLLTMTSGLDCNDWDKKSKGQEDKVHKKKDWIQYTLDLPMIHEPGEVASYCSMGTVLLAEMISQASGMSLQAFAHQYLFEPLGISNASWGHTSEKNVIPSSKRLYMTPRDLAKIGQLILNKGQWNDKQVVSENWIRESTTSKTKITGINYGYLWWSLPFQIQNQFQMAPTATGNGGQYIMAFPKLDLVVVFTGGAYNSEKDKIPFAIVKDVLLPTFSN